MLLAIDTSAGSSVAVVDGPDRVVVQLDEEGTRSHAERIGPLLRAALAEAGIAPRELSGVVAGMGPGPFTGLRVGIAAARAFAAGIGRPVIPLVSHDALALDRSASVVVVTDARRREAAWSHYAAPDGTGIPLRLRGPELARRDDLDEVLAGVDARERVDAPTVPAGALGLLAARLLAAGTVPDAIEPLYLRAPDVTPSAGPKRVTA
jgi:tRNA threonylcarbamoyl adenosine modification protein YeaZ